MSEYAYINGCFVKSDEARISIFDRGFLYGDGLFETMRAYSGRVFMVEDHIQRLFESADVLEIPLERDRDALRSAIERLLDLNSLYDAYIRLTVSRGIHSGVLTFNGSYEPTVIITAKELSPYPPEYYAHGAKVIIGSIRQNSFSPLSHHKSLSYFGNLLVKEEARKKGAIDAVLLNTEGDVAECATSNIFIVRSEQIFTPSLWSHILPGVTRKVILTLAPQLGLEVEEKKIRQEELFASDEVLLTNSLMEVMPVVEINGEKVGSGKPGPFSVKIAEAYKTSVRRFCNDQQRSLYSGRHFMER